MMSAILLPIVVFYHNPFILSITKLFSPFLVLTVAFTARHLSGWMSSRN